MVNVDGLISGIDTETIIKGLLEVQQAQVDRLTLRKNDVQAKQGAMQTFQARLIAFQGTAGSLTRSQASLFDSRTVSVSDSNALVATAASRASLGVYQIKVESLAKAHQVASQGFSDAGAPITEGVFSIRVGSQPAAQITINSSNNTLTGLADAINQANVGVSASVVQDGSNSGTPYRLLLTSAKTGVDNQISITNDLAASFGNAVQPTFDLGNPVQSAANARVRLGDGPGAIAVESQTNQISNLITGVTLNLLTADPAKTISVSVGQNVETASTAVKDFVNGYNSLMDFIDSLTKYDAATEEAGILWGERGLIDLQNQMRSLVQSVVPGLPSSINRLSTIGITFTDKGRLALNESRLQDAIQGKIEGVTSADVRRLFALDGRSSSGNVEFLLGSAKTKDSNAPYTVRITQAATRGTVTAGSALAANTDITTSNNQLTLNLDGADITINLKTGTYTREQLANEIGKTINAHPDVKGRQIVTSIDADGAMHLTSAAYGGSSKVSIGAGSAIATLGFVGGESGVGQDVAGHFIVNGQVEAATGSGRVLTGSSTNANTADLQVRVTYGSSQVNGGIDADLTVTRGIAARLDVAINKSTSADRGVLKNIDDQYAQQIKNIQASMTRQQGIFDRQKDSLVKQFTALESALGKLQSTSGFLASQLSSMGSLSR